MSLLNFFRRRSADGLEDYEEVNEKKTTSIGYVLLILMVIFIVSISQTIFSDLRRIPERPVAPSRCIENILTNYKDAGSYTSPCNFEAIDRRFNLDTLYEGIEPDLEKIANYNYQIRNFQAQISANSKEITRLENSYNLSLQEKIADERALYNTGNLQSSIANLRQKNSEFQAEINSYNSLKQPYVESVAKKIPALERAYKDAKDSYTLTSSWYKFKAFALMLIFVLPFFVISTKLYFTLKKRNSPYTIIATAVMAASSILFLQIVFTFLYEILPKEWFEIIFKIFALISALRVILYYLVVLLVIAIFGGIVYIIQKRVFDPRRIAVRRLKDNKCPRCSFAINPFEDYCPHCGEQLKERCAQCNNKRISNLPFCPVCGNRKPSSVPVQQ